MVAGQNLILIIARVAFAAAVVVMAAAPFLFGATEIVLLTEFMSMLVLAIMWNLLAGYADIVTVGQHAFVGVGAYSFFGVAALWGLNPYLAIPLAGLVALVIAVPAMVLVFRLRTAYLAIGTWVVAEVLLLAAGKLTAFGGGSGTSLPMSIALSFGRARADRLAAIYWLAFALAAVAMLVTHRDARQRGRRRRHRRQHHLRPRPVFPRHRSVPRHGRRNHHFAKTPHRAVRVVQHHRLDGLHHLQRGDRWHRQF
jgi:branched-chain amino acid transport system permease protein